jgi:hypothetical protein
MQFHPAPGSYSACFGQPFCPSSGVLSRTSALVHFCRFDDHLLPGVESDELQMAVRSMPITCCITKATDTHSTNVIFTALSLQKILHKRATMLRYTNTVCLVS